MSHDNTQEQATLFGHPVGLFTIFFAEMWERFSYYGMRALLVFYMIKGFLGLNDNDAYGIYGAYTALVYASPFIGGMLADQLLGARRAVIVGGLLMAAGHLLMGVENSTAFFVALALLICGNGFFKPNISTIVGGLYPKGSGKKDAGFTIFYMGINLGAAMSPVVCGYVGETYGWHYGFGLATIGMLIGVAVFVAPTWLTQMLIGGGALFTAVAMPFFQNTPLQLAIRLILAVALVIAAGVACLALQRGGLPRSAGAPPDPKKLRTKIAGLPAEWWVYIGTALTVPLIALVVQRNTLAGYCLIFFGVAGLGYLLFEMFGGRCSRVERHRLAVVLVLLFFSMLFWAFFEQAGSSLNNFADRNVDRTFEERSLVQADVGTTIEMRVSPAPEDATLRSLPLLSQDQLGFTFQGAPFNMTALTKLREAAKTEAEAFKKLTEEKKALPPAEAQTVSWVVSAEHVGMKLGGAEVPASEFQAINPMCILLFGLVLTALWSILAQRRMEPSTTTKFALGLLQLALGFAALWYGAQQSDDRGMVALPWLILAYVLHTTGELCLSPVGLSMVTKLSPARIVSTVMGAWFLALAFSNFLAAVIATFTGVESKGEGEQVIPVPSETVNLYGDVFGTIAIAGIISAVICFALAPLLNKWTHADIEGDGRELES